MGQPGRMIRNATQNDRQPLANLIHFQTFIHRHLDWRTPLDWLDSQPYLVLEQDQRMQAVLACPPDPPEIAWLRLFGVDSHADVQGAWQVLWSAARQMLAEKPGIRAVAAIALQTWLCRIAARQWFYPYQRCDLVDLGHRHLARPAAPQTLFAAQYAA